MNRTIMLMLGVLVAAFAVVLLAGCSEGGDAPDVPEELEYDPTEEGKQPATPSEPSVDEM